jgi:hypothetical protein
MEREFMTIEDPTTEQGSIRTQSDRLLNPEQRIICEQVAIEETLNSRRAQALLIVDDGATQAEAGQQSGLTLYQVKYCLTRFRKLGVAMFPIAAPAASQPDPDPASGPVPEPEPLPNTGEAETMVGETINKTGNKVSKGKKNKKKRSKSKQGKGRKKGKKAKSGKSTKKSRKKKVAKKGKGKSTKPKKKDAGGKKGRISKSGKSSRKREKR